jgi:hypothetical protein
LILESCGVLLKKSFFLAMKWNFLGQWTKQYFFFCGKSFFGDEMEISLTVDEAESVILFFVVKKKK